MLDANKECRDAWKVEMSFLKDDHVTVCGSHIVQAQLAYLGSFQMDIRYID